MPEIVAKGRRPAVNACGYCHTPGGQGRPENASLAGLPAPYIVQQVADFKSGARRSACPDSYVPTALMIDVATHPTAAEVTSAATCFSQQRPILTEPRVCLGRRSRGNRKAQPVSFNRTGDHAGQLRGIPPRDFNHLAWFRVEEASSPALGEELSTPIRCGLRCFMAVVFSMARTSGADTGVIAPMRSSRRLAE